MLVGSLNGKPIDALGAIRGLNYLCPNPKCNSQLILRQGRQVVHHFAHKPPRCDWASSETPEHREAKRALLDSLKSRGLRAEAEFIVDTLPGDRRADVMAWRPDNQMVAFELQHSAISLDEIERRAASYARAGIAQIWIPFLRDKFVSASKKEGGFIEIERYTPRPFERWVHLLHNKDGMWMYCPSRKSMWLAFLKPTQLYREETSWYSESGEEMSSGGYSYPSKRYCDLTLWGPFNLNALKVRINSIKSRRVENYNLPTAKIATFVRSESD